MEPVAVPVETKTEPKKEIKAVKPETLIEPVSYEDFESSNGVPFVAKHFGIEDYYKQDLDGETKPKVDKIMEYLRKYGDLVTLGGELLKKIESKINISDDEKPLSKLERIFAYITSSERLSKLKAEKDKVEKLIKEEVKKKTPNIYN